MAENILALGANTQILTDKGYFKMSDLNNQEIKVVDQNGELRIAHVAMQKEPTEKPIRISIRWRHDIEIDTDQMAKVMVANDRFGMDGIVYDAKTVSAISEDVKGQVFHLPNPVEYTDKWFKIGYICRNAELNHLYCDGFRGFDVPVKENDFWFDAFKEHEYVHEEEYDPDKVADADADATVPEDDEEYSGFIHIHDFVREIRELKPDTSPLEHRWISKDTLCRVPDKQLGRFLMGFFINNLPYERQDLQAQYRFTHPVINLHNWFVHNKLIKQFKDWKIDVVLSKDKQRAYIMRPESIAVFSTLIGCIKLGKLTNGGGLLIRDTQRMSDFLEKMCDYLPKNDSARYKELPKHKLYEVSCELGSNDYIVVSGLLMK